MAVLRWQESLPWSDPDAGYGLSVIGLFDACLVRLVPYAAILWSSGAVQLDYGVFSEWLWIEFGEACRPDGARAGSPAAAGLPTSNEVRTANGPKTDQMHSKNTP